MRNKKGKTLLKPIIPTIISFKATYSKMMNHLGKIRSKSEMTRLFLVIKVSAQYSAAGKRRR